MLIFIFDLQTPFLSPNTDTNDNKFQYKLFFQTVLASCGNGIIEGDEECDCGTPEVNQSSYVK